MGDTLGFVSHYSHAWELDTDDPTLVDIPELPPLMLDQSFFMPVSAIRSFFQTVTRVPFYRFPKTLGWPTMDVTLEPAPSPASPSFSNLHSLLAVLPNFFPPSVQALLSSYKTDDAHGPSHFYTSEAYAHLQQLNIRPGTSSSSMDIEYTWPLNWDIPNFTSILEPLYFMHSLHSTHPNLLPLLRSLGPHFLRSLTSALLASNNTSPRYCSPLSMACAPGTQPSASKESSELGKPLAPPSCSSSSPPSSTLTLFSPLNPTCPWQQQSKTLTSSSKMPPTMSEHNTAVSSPTTSRSALNST